MELDGKNACGKVSRRNETVPKASQIFFMPYDTHSLQKISEKDAITEAMTLITCGAPAEKLTGY